MVNKKTSSAKIIISTLQYVVRMLKKKLRRQNTEPT
jgi:hypothetical protein